MKCHPFLLAPGRIPNNSAILILTRIGPRQRIAHVVPLACIIRNDPGHFVIMFGHQLGRILLDGGIEGVGPLHDPRRETTVSKQFSVDTQGRRGQKHLFRSGNPISISIEQVNDQIQYKLYNMNNKYNTKLVRLIRFMKHSITKKDRYRRKQLSFAGRRNLPS